MRLNKLILNGFKSFCNKTEFVFPKNITGIVGPNGSGKSNIADAVRWVLGEQNPRLLRGGKMEDVIFNGTQKKKAMNFCEVSLLFDNDDHSLHPDYLEIMVTRRVYRSGESEYEINNSPCRLKDIIELFSDTGIGKEGYSIIGQGKIDEILSRKTEDRRAVFEEAAGINYYKLKKRESELKLSRAEENLLRINDIAYEQERMLGPLLEQANNAKKYLVLSEELKDLSAALFLVDYDRLNAKEKLNEKNLAAIEIDIAEFEKNVSNLGKLIETEQQNSIKYEETASTIAEKVILANKHLVETREIKNNSEFELEKNKENVARLNEELNEIVQKRASIINDDDSVRIRVEEVKSKLEQAEKELFEHEKNLENEHNKFLEITSNLESSKEKLIENMNSLNKSESSKARFLAIKEQMQERAADLESSLSKLKEANSAFKKKYDEIKISYDKEEKLKAEEDQKLSLINKSLEETILSMRKLKLQIDEINNNISAKSSRLKTMQDLAKSYEGYSPAVKYAMQCAKRRNMDKVYGTLASIINVPKEYEIAIDMVLGGALQNIVCEDEESAKILIEDLRKSSAGRATFLPISSVLPYNINSNELKNISRDSYIDVASNLISYDPKFKNIVENLLGRTLIIKSIDDGISIRRKNCKLKMVSLIGDVMHSGGSITGGSVKTKNSGFLSRNRLLNELGEEIKSESSKLELTKNQYVTLADKRESLETDRQKSELLCHEREVNLIKLNEALKAAVDDANSFNEKEEELQNAIDSLKQSISDIENSLSNVTREHSDIEKENAELNERISLLDSEHTKQEKIYSDMQELMLSIKLNHSNIEHEFQQLKKDENLKQNILSDYKAKEVSIQNEINNLRSTFDILLEKSAKAVQDLKSEEKALESLENEQREIEKNRSESSKKIRSLQEEEKNISKSHLKSLDKKHSLEIQISNISSEKKLLCDNLWTRFELTYSGAERFRQNEKFDKATAQTRVKQINEDIRALGSVNVNAINEYSELQARHSELIVQKEDLQKSIDDLNKIISILLKNMEKQFVENFSKLKEYFTETFSELFGGGNGELKLTDPNNALECGIEIIVQPPGKKKQMLSLFSGGERSLTAIALIFAMLKLRPSPFCIFDEIEAALDDANINNFADYLKQFSDNTQFIVVTHRKGTMERCDSLYGIAMAEKGVSSVLSLDISDYNN